MLYNVIFSLIFTILIEFIVSVFCGINNKFDLLNIIWINILTNPSTEMINLLIKNSDFHYPIIIIIEILIIIIEFLFYKKNLKTKNINFLYLSVINNVSSYLIGIMFNLGGNI